LPWRIDYVVDPKLVNGFGFRSSGLFLGKLLLHIFACGEANPWFLSGLQKWRRRKDAILSCQRVSCQGSGAVLPFAYFDCAPVEGNYLQQPAVGPTGFGRLDVRMTDVVRRLLSLHHETRMS
jgi:hypothetical protein